MRREHLTWMSTLKEEKKPHSVEKLYTTLRSVVLHKQIMPLFYINEEDVMHPISDDMGPEKVLGNPTPLLPH